MKLSGCLLASNNQGIGAVQQDNDGGLEVVQQSLWVDCICKAQDKNTDVTNLIDCPCPILQRGLEGESKWWLIVSLE